MSCGNFLKNSLISLVWVAWLSVTVIVPLSFSHKWCISSLSLFSGKRISVGFGKRHTSSWLLSIISVCDNFQLDVSQFTRSPFENDLEAENVYPHNCFWVFVLIDGLTCKMSNQTILGHLKISTKYWNQLFGRQNCCNFSHSHWHNASNKLEGEIPLVSFSNLSDYHQCGLCLRIPHSVKNLDK